MNRIKGILKNIFRAIMAGDLLVHIQISKYFVHILYGFSLFFIIIWVSLKIDATLTKVEINKSRIYEQELVITARRLELSSLGCRSTVERMLKEKGSKLCEPTEPPTVLDNETR